MNTSRTNAISNVIPFRSPSLAIKLPGKPDPRPSNLPTSTPEKRILKGLRGKLHTILSASESYDHPLYGQAISEGVRFCLDDIESLLKSKGGL